MGRRYDAATYLRRLEPLGDFNLTTDVIVGFPAEDEPRLPADARGGRGGGRHQGARLPVLAAPGHGDRGRGHRAARRSRSERSAGCAAPRTPRASRAGATKLGREDVVLVDRPGRGYGDDYSPWLVDAPVGELVRVRGAAVTEEGIRRCLRTASSARSSARASTCTPRDGFVAIRDIHPKADTHLLVLPERHVSTFREIAEFPPEEAKRMLDFVAETAQGSRARGLSCRRQRRARAPARRSSTCTGTCSAAASKGCPG